MLLRLLESTITYYIKSEVINRVGLLKQHIKELKPSWECGTPLIHVISGNLCVYYTTPEDNSYYFDEPPTNSIAVMRFSDHLYPSVVYRNEMGSIWIRNGKLLAFASQRGKRSIEFSNNADFSMELEDLSGSDLFNLRISVGNQFDNDILLELVSCYKLIKQKRLNILYDVTI